MDLELHAVLRANEDYRTSALHTAARTPRPARRLVILTCMDTRLDLFGALGLEVGDAHILRNAGGRVTPDAIRSLVVSSHLLGTREVGVIHHTNCGLEGCTEADIAARTGVAGIDYLSFASVEESVEEDVDVIRRCGHLPEDVWVWGAVYDVDSGALQVVAPPASL